MNNYKTNSENCIDKSIHRLCKKWDKIGSYPPKDTYDCLICGENFPMMPFSALPLYEEENDTYNCKGNLCKNCFLLVDQFIQQKQQEFELK